MKYHQRDIVEIDFPIPGEGYKVHPAVIVSNDELQLDEGRVLSNVRFWQLPLILAFFGA